MSFPRGWFAILLLVVLGVAAAALWWTGRAAAPASPPPSVTGGAPAAATPSEATTERKAKSTGGDTPSPVVELCRRYCAKLTTCGVKATDECGVTCRTVLLAGVEAKKYQCVVLKKCEEISDCGI